MRRYLIGIYMGAFTDLIFSGCSANKGPATNAYFRAYLQASDNLVAEIKPLPPVNPPPAPFLPAQASGPERRAFLERRRNYPAAMAEYYSEFITRGRLLENIYGRYLAQISALNGAGVEPSVVALVTLREQVIGKRREQITELGRLMALFRQKLTDGDLNKLVSNVVSKAAIGFLAAPGSDGTSALVGAAKGFSDFASQVQQDDAAVGDQARAVAAVTTELQREVFKYQTAFAQVRTSVEANYPDQDWSFLGPKPASAAQ